VVPYHVDSERWACTRCNYQETMVNKV